MELSWRMAQDAGGVLVVSNRGPVSFSRGSDGTLVSRRGGGGLVSSLGPLVRRNRATWVAAAITEHDRAAALARPGVVELEGYRLLSLTLDPVAYELAYDVVANATLWFLHHGLFDLARRPSFDRRWWEAWRAYREVNARFAEAIAEEAPADAVVLVQDYHLALVGRLVAERRPDLRSVHFTHIPFCTPDGLRVLPTDVAAELLAGMAGAQACGFHDPRWTANFEACCQAVLGTVPPTFTAPITPDADELAATAASPDCAEARAWLDEQVGARRVISRVERIEPSKNLLRGLAAFDELLASRIDLRGEVILAAFVYPSRESLPEYRSYRGELEHLAADINARWGRPGWDPVLLDTSDNYARSVAALVRYDVLMVNPVRDGLNLVAKEGPLVNRRDGVLVLSQEAGAASELGAALQVNPFDVSATARALAAALDLPAEERRSHAAALRSAVRASAPSDWFAAQLRAAGTPEPSGASGAGGTAPSNGRTTSTAGAAGSEPGQQLLQ